jgi:hypothetical protein
MARTAPLPLRAGLPRPEPYVAQATALVCEVLTGMRAPGQLQRWATLEVEQQLARRAALLPVAPRGVARPRAVVLSTHPMAVAPDALMVSVVFRHNGRARAAGMRFDARHGRWIVTEVQVAP